MRDRKYFIELALAMALYTVLLLGAKAIDHAYHPTGGGQIALALLPTIGCVAALVVILRGIRRMDEFQRRIQFEAIAFAFAGTALGTFSYGFLEGAGLPRMPTFAVWPVMAVLWIVGQQLACRRYR